MTTTHDLAEAIQALDFDHPFILTATGDLMDAPGEYAPEVYHVEEVPGVEMEIHGPWRPVLHGLSNQYAYRGPVMHASEQVSEGIVRRLLDSIPGDAEAATFAIVAVEVYPDADNPEPFPAGWTIVMLDPED
jgi:hypothetical protein